MTGPNKFFPTATSSVWSTHLTLILGVPLLGDYLICLLCIQHYVPEGWEACLGFVGVSVMGDDCKLKSWQAWKPQRDNTSQRPELSKVCPVPPQLLLLQEIPYTSRLATLAAGSSVHKCWPHQGFVRWERKGAVRRAPSLSSPGLLRMHDSPVRKSMGMASGTLVLKQNKVWG